jgi:hypothetical protein
LHLDLAEGDLMVWRAYRGSPIGIFGFAREPLAAASTDAAGPELGDTIDVGRLPRVRE